MSIMHKTIGQSCYQLYNLYIMQYLKKELRCHYLKQIMGMHLRHHCYQNKQRSQAKLAKKELKS